MAFEWDDNWNGFDGNMKNNDGSTKEQITQLLANASNVAGHNSGDAGLIAALSAQSNTVKILKGIHQEDVNKNPHITVAYLGGTWHVNLVQTATAYRFRNVSQWK